MKKIIFHYYKNALDSMQTLQIINKHLVTILKANFKKYPNNEYLLIQDGEPINYFQ